MGLTHLKKQLARLAKTAWVQPVALTRYNNSWGRIVSYAMWLKKIGLAAPIPAEHPLLRLRAHVDGLLYDNPALLSRLSAALPDGLIATCMVRAMTLQVVYGIDSPRYLYEQVGYNMLYRHFIGVEVDMPPAQVFVDGIRMLRGNRQVIELLERLLAQAPLAVIEANTGIAVDRALPRAWLAQAAATAVPADGNGTPEKK